MRVGDELAELVLAISRSDLIRYCGAANDLVPLHWDQDMVRAAGYPDVVVNGWLGCAHLCRAATRVLTPDRWLLARYAVRYRQPLFPGEVRCGGTVARADTEQVVVDAWLRDGSGRVVTTGQLEFGRRK